MVMGEAKRRQQVVSLQTSLIYRAQLRHGLEVAQDIFNTYDLPTAIVLAHKSRDRSVKEAIDDLLAKTAVAECRRGCAFCCYQLVSCAPAEIFRIARHLFKNGLDTEELREKLHWLSLLPIEPEARYRKPCPFLAGTECSIYNDRPMACRSHFSASAKGCEQSFKSEAGADVQVPFITEPKAMASLTQMAIDYILSTKHGINIEKVELCGGLLKVLTAPDPDALFDRWCRGEDVFAGHHDWMPEGYPKYETIMKEAVAAAMADG